MKENIQCLRGIAIIFVFLFHLFPKNFPNGYLGVDMFFVLSGYLMTMILSKHDLHSLQTYAVFFYKRIHRIFPLYYLMTLLIFIGVHVLLLEFWWPANLRYSIFSLPFVLNQLIIHDSGSYFDQFMADGNSRNAFLHLWSLSVEVQFYLIFPFIFIMTHHMRYDWQKLFYFGALALGSLAFHLIANYQFVFQFTLARLWEFFAGSFAFYASKILGKSSEFDKNKLGGSFVLPSRIRLILLYFLCILPIFPTVISMRFMRVIITFIMAVLLTDDDEHAKTNRILSSSMLSYIGDASYSIYLVHWPVIVFFDGNQLINKHNCIALTILISFLIYHLYEMFYRRLSYKVVIPLVIFLIFGNICAQTLVRTTDIGALVNRKLDGELAQAYKINAEFVNQDLWHRQQCTGKLWNKEHLSDINFPSYLEMNDMYGHCEWPRGNGTLKFLVMGNSYASNMIQYFRDIFKNTYGEFHSIIIIGNDVVYYDESDWRNSTWAANRKIVELVKPDVILGAYRIESLLEETPLELPLEEDPAFQQMVDNIRFYEKYTKKILLMDVVIRPILKHVTMVLERIYKDAPLKDMNYDKEKMDRYLRHSTRRFSALKSLRCEKCEFYDLKPLLTSPDGMYYMGYDPVTMHSYYDDTCHFTKASMARMRPFFERMNERLVEELVYKISDYRRSNNT